MKVLICFFLTFTVFSQDKATRILVEKEIKKYQAAVFTFKKNNVEVHYFSSIHIGQKAYYGELNKRFKKFDAVLYEKVKGYQEALQKGGVKENVWELLANILKLKSQLKSINYKAENFVHADMTWEELKGLEGKYKISKEDLFNPKGMNKTIAAFKQAPPSTLMGFYRNIFNKEELKHPVIVSLRNKKCIRVLDEQSQKHKTLAIFYGAAHFKDMKKRLEQKGFKQISVSWITVFQE
jgi:hypothetical protein